MIHKLILLLLSSLVLSPASIAQTSLEGDWHGQLQVQSVSLPLVFRLKNDSQQWKGEMQSPKQAPTFFPLSQVTLQGDSIYLSLETMAIAYAGKISADGNTIQGQFTQGNLKQELTLTRADQQKTEQLGHIKRSQLVEPPYPYDTLAVRFKNTIAGIELKGTLSSPRENGKFPAVVLVSGSGPQNRDSEIFNHKPFKVLADYLTRRGVIVLRYDDRGIGESEGDFASAITSDFGQDALAALNFLSQQKAVDPNRLGIIGHSEGALIATILAGQHADKLDFIVSLAGPSIPMDSLLLMQNDAIMQVSGHTMSAQEREIIQKNYQIAASGLNDQQAMEAILENAKPLIGENQQQQAKEEFSTLLSPWFRHFLGIDPRPFIRKIRIPVFAAFGGKDVQVPAEQNAASLRANLPDSQENRIHIYPGLNHLFQLASTGSVMEYASIEETMNLEVLADILRWIKQANSAAAD